MGPGEPSDPTLFDVDPLTPRRDRPAVGPRPTAARPEGRIVRVVCDIASIDRRFDYVVPPKVEARAAFPLAVGTMVRVPLHGRQVGAWVVAVDPESEAGVALRPITKISGIGPPAEIVDLCRWAARRWVGRLPTFLGAASPPTMVSRPATPAPLDASPAGEEPVVGDDERVAVLRLPPAESPVPAIASLVGRGRLLVVCPTIAAARRIGDGMRRAGIATVQHPDGWARGAAGASVVGARGAVFAPVAGLGAIVVVDEHDESLQNEGSPTWHARDVAIERGRRAGVPVLLVSPAPSLEALDAVAAAGGRVRSVERSRERAGWARLRVVDRRDEDVARTGLFSDELVAALRRSRRALCVLNRTGRARLVACGRCGTLAACARCAAAVVLDEDAALACGRCGTTRPVVCAECGATSMRQLRIGVTKAAEQLEALLREPVAEISGSARGGSGHAATRSARVVVGTEAALHRIGEADLVAFLEFDQELGAPRYRAAEEAIALLARSSRLVGGRRGDVLVQTRQPDHPVLAAALDGDPSALVAEERQRRELLRLPPASTVAVVGGEAGAAFVETLRELVGDDPSVTVDRREGPNAPVWLVRGDDRRALLDALNGVERPPGRLRLQVDPARLPR